MGPSRIADENRRH